MGNTRCASARVATCATRNDKLSQVDQRVVHDQCSSWSWGIIEQLADLDRERDDEIRTLLAARTNTVHEIAEVAGLSWQRIYQIRDGRR